MLIVAINAVAAIIEISSRSSSVSISCTHMVFHYACASLVLAFCYYDCFIVAFLILFLFVFFLAGLLTHVLRSRGSGGCAPTNPLLKSDQHSARTCTV